ncbi:hypothetical protein QQF64_033937 [Cirrhinus molitorella]|uniref:Transposase element L1Md-A101/L1Md-A102/L1Md-A2 n=1 Tax=Cirrhinus molitorella TaxID=172907 RepID=A0ABR3MVD7_9TELE
MKNKSGKVANPSSSHQRPAVLAAPATPRSSDSPAKQTDASAENAALKTELLSSLRNDIAEIFRSELQTALGDDLSTIKSELQAVKAEFTNTMVTVQTDMADMKNTIKDMEQSLSSCSDDVTVIQEKVDFLSTEVKRLEDKCEDLEARSRRNNIRIVGVPEDTLVTTSVVSKLLRDALHLDKDIIVDRSHRTLQPKPKPNERPRAIVAKLHYHSDCVEILRQARQLRHFKVGDMSVSFFPDLTSKVARARAAFGNVRRQLQGIPGIKFGFLHPARLRVTYDGLEKQFNRPDEAEAYVKSILSQPG